MNIRNMAIAAVGGLLAAARPTPATRSASGDKCYGVAKAGQNDCAAGNGHLRRPGQEGQRPERVEAHAEGPVREDGRQDHAPAK